MARATRRADEEGRFDRAVGETIAFGVAGRRAVFRHRAAITFPAGRAAVQREPALAVETRVGKLAITERTGRRAELEITRRLALVRRLGVRIRGIDRRIAEVAGGIAIPFLADVRQQLVVARAPLKAVGFVERLRGT